MIALIRFASALVASQLKSRTRPEAENASQRWPCPGHRCVGPVSHSSHTVARDTTGRTAGASVEMTVLFAINAPAA